MYKKIKGNIFIILFTIIISSIAIASITDFYYTGKKNANIRSNIGKRIVVVNDTLEIVGCSFMDCTYMLSNRTKISFKYGDKKLNKE